LKLKKERKQEMKVKAIFVLAGGIFFLSLGLASIFLIFSNKTPDPVGTTMAGTFAALIGAVFTDGGISALSSNHSTRLRKLAL